jgi:hypothetical protein
MRETVERHGGLAVTRFPEDEERPPEGEFDRSALGPVQPDVDERRRAPAFRRWSGREGCPQDAQLDTGMICGRALELGHRARIVAADGEEKEAPPLRGEA